VAGRTAHGRAAAGYSLAAGARGRSVTAGADCPGPFAWTISALYRIELHIEPWNVASIRTAERAGYRLEELLRSRQRIGSERRDMLLYAGDLRTSS
jgi:RimJ/RimL family protein N-acetyltransferase